MGEKTHTRQFMKDWLNIIQADLKKQAKEYKAKLAGGVFKVDYTLKHFSDAKFGEGEQITLTYDIKPPTMPKSKLLGGHTHIRPPRFGNYILGYGGHYEKGWGHGSFFTVRNHRTAFIPTSEFLDILYSHGGIKQTDYTHEWLSRAGLKPGGRTYFTQYLDNVTKARAIVEVYPKGGRTTQRFDVSAAFTDSLLGEREQLISNSFNKTVTMKAEGFDKMIAEVIDPHGLSRV